MDRDKKLDSISSYKLTGKLLGEGNFARVHEAIHLILGTKVAIKAIKKSRLQQYYVMKNLKREAQILFQLNHPCVLRLYETIRYQDNYYLVTEKINGGDLNSYLTAQPNRRLQEEQTLRFASQLLSAVNHLHKHFVVHRDLKLENILVDKRKDWIKLIDFGLSNSWSRQTLLVTNCGSPEYAAPELFIQGKGYGPEVDLWSLGVVFFVMAAGRLPFRLREPAGDSFPTSQRTTLYHQISRGLTTRHYRSIKNYSAEFLHLLEKLLTPAADRRISVSAAMRSAWITGAKKGVVPSKWRLGIRQHVKIMEEISVLTDTNTLEINTALKYEPYGKLGGLYNILSHHKMLQDLQSVNTNRMNTRSSSKFLNIKSDSVICRKSY